MTTTIQTVDLRAEPTEELLRPLGQRPRAAGRGRLAHRALLASDVAGIALAFVAAGLATRAGWPSTGEIAVLVGLLACWAYAASLAGLYSADDRSIGHSTADEVVGVVLLVTLGSWTLLAVSHLARAGADSTGKLLVFWLAAIATVTSARAATRALLRRSAGFRQLAVVLGADPTGRLVVRKLRQHAEYGIDVVGLVDATAEADGDAIGTPADLPELVRQLGIERVIVSFGAQTVEETLDAIRSLRGFDVYVDVVPRLYEVLPPSGRIHAIEGLPLIDLPPFRMTRPARVVKRTLDVVGATVALVLAAPLFVVVPILIRLESPGPAFFRQVRLGERMRKFSILKFRTMRVDVDEARHRDFIRATMDASSAPQANGLFKLDRTGDVTRVGAWLRRTSLDELPQLVNVLRGEMALVGPRPCIPYETQFFRPHHFERFLVPAGITGLWQVVARGRSTFGEALDMDVAYARGWSLGLDLTLLLRTARQLVTRKETT